VGVDDEPEAGVNLLEQRGGTGGILIHRKWGWGHQEDKRHGSRTEADSGAT
jgi:hypothetical protein